MTMYNGTFSKIYKQLLEDIQQYPINFECNTNKMLYEMMNVELNICMVNNQVSIYSHELTKALPITFTLAEFLTMLTCQTDISHLCYVNKNMINYTSSIHTDINGITHYYAPQYGVYLYWQLPLIMKALSLDKYTRQACAVIWQTDELNKKHKSCNVFLQFIIRDNKLNLIVVSRSSDLLTGLQIDSFHWQALLLIFYNELIQTYADLELGNVIYKITTLHVYEKDKFIFDYLHNELPLIEKYAHQITLSQTFTELKLIAPEVVNCVTLADINKLYGFDLQTLDTIVMLDFIFKCRQHKLKR